jgi:hypothetical protein
LTGNDYNVPIRIDANEHAAISDSIQGNRCADDFNNGSLLVVSVVSSLMARSGDRPDPSGDCTRIAKDHRDASFDKLFEQWQTVDGGVQQENNHMLQKRRDRPGPKPRDSIWFNKVGQDRGIINRNHVLRSLPHATLEKILPDLEPLNTVRGQVIDRVDRPIEYIYFVSRGLVSFRSKMFV